MTKRRVGIVLLAIGVVLILSALLLFAYNRWVDAKAGTESEALLESVQSVISDENADVDKSTVSLDPEMPTVMIDGYDYIGYLSVPTLELELPVMADWDYPRLKIAPCCHFGSSRTDDLVIAAHNFDAHFGKLPELEPGARITFTDMEGVVNTYSVAEHMKVDPQAVEVIRDSEYDLVLYTCTYGGSARVAVGCVRVEE